MGDHEEIRLALALNGGVSLAIWMGGTAVELDAARRAHLGPEALHEDGGEKRTRHVYAGIAKAFNRRLVPDVMAGSSAGGINSALLAAASVSGRRLHPDFVRKKWVDLADLDTLLQPTNANRPASLMQGQMFKDRLNEIFVEILDKKRTDSLNFLPADQQTAADHDGKPHPPTIEITATDLAGEPVEVKDSWGDSLRSSESPQLSLTSTGSPARSVAVISIVGG